MKRLISFILLIVFLGAGGIFMTMEGKDAVTMASIKKSSLLTADNSNLSFQGVGGKVTAIMVTEEQQIKLGEVLITLDPTDLDLQITKVKTEIQQQDVKIKQTKAQVTRTEDLERQMLVVEASQQTLNLAQTNYDRTKALYDAGAVALTNLDTVSYQLDTAKNVLSQQQALAKKIEAQISTDIQNNAYNIEALQKQKEAMQVQLQSLEVQKQRMILKAPSDGKVTRIIPKIGENTASGAPVVTIESDQLYYTIYVDETQITKYKVDESVTGQIAALNKKVEGKVRYITSAPQYASMRMSRDKGQSDVSSFLVRIDVQRTPELLPGMIVEVNTSETTN
ncbi:HlyD family secretion protein [Desulfosporosinus nitroreducens]|uniref:HlyD family efflux transporter periplasmic adaptor subunit n=1 Tax=Desulfosporosinus nitroreducens TaxID=2018668 RepID=A0ABT8QMJ3_9FIRM|nr:HlyD family efflux transporter periplasmic adaptor subunit [Desulfosporosinus nitroreducens]MDO0822552.1 HlyD family efflux transporter periplasmic adaptor subunit [Desulfosporosinus nitroreducens]